MHAAAQIDDLSQGVVVALRVLGPFRLVASRYAPDSALARHSHAVSKISLILSGGTAEHHRRDGGSFAAGCVVVKPKGAEHANRMGPRGLRSFALSCDETDSRIAAKWTGATARYTWIDSKSLSRALFELYADVLASNRPDAELRLYDHMAAILTLLLGAACSPRRAPDWIRDVRDYLHENASASVSLARLAADIGHHPVYVARVFRRHFGCSMSDYLSRQRVRRAASLLAETGQPASIIAQLTGFADHAHLCRVFKAHWGATPGQFRQAVGGAASRTP
jgi:AraC family transcriptional regulator